ncbi:MAG: xanthine dehydrogenase family protein molybdopterin-binding subunit [Bacillati bacterium ANGP1]|uniref:Xanthine dehydrogenase family protein molybdopterin-binding subunit n=1 Tax=Candidatus Segetimicrobium genomatis TaxID=2569760 RepID=A0A537J0E7_9BACT|nr:MAG: xanthine dehydrogenase family protein molybdopterin-binding subunit [Terrabacteria group bacterium ANGP1]
MTESATHWIGRPVRRREDPRFLRGQARYVDDVVLPGMAHMAVVRSSVAHAIVRKVDVSAARRSSGVLAVVTAADLAGAVRPAPPNPVEGAEIAPVPHPVLASGTVRYVGEPVAAVLALTASAAQDAAEHVVVDYDPLPAVVDPRRALNGPVRLHAQLPDNVLSRWQRTHGDVDGAFARAARVVRQQFRIPRLAAAPIEPRGVVAVYDPGADLLTVWISAQDPHRPLNQLSRMLGRPDDRIRVIVPDVGGGFGSKGSVAVDVAVAAWLAIRTGRPVKWVEARRENLATAYQGRGLEVEMELAVDAAGTMLAVRARVIADLGAYLYPPTAMVPVTTSMLLTGAYAIPNASVEMVGVATNKVPTGPYRGAGRPEAAYVVEQMVDLAARELEMDPIVLRRRNVVAPDRFPYRTPLGFTYDSGNYDRALDRAYALLEYDRWRGVQTAARREGRLVGVGMALYVERAGSALWESAAVSVTPAGRVVVRIGSTPNGQGHATIFSQIAAEVLQVNLEAITVEQGDSAVVPRGVGTFGSRSTTIGGSALLRAAEKVKAKAVRIAAHLLEGRAEDIVWADSRLYVRGAPDRALTLPEVAAAAYQPGRLPQDLEMGLDALDVFRLPGPVFPFGAYGAVVEISPSTGEIRVLRLVAVDDAGRIVNPLLAEGQVIGGLVQGLGEALAEEVVYGEDGQFLTATFAEYGIPRAEQVPEIVSEFLETPSPLNPLGAKGIGEAGCIATPAAVANAVMDALAPLGIRHLDFPFTPRLVWEAIARARPR